MRSHFKYTLFAFLIMILIMPVATKAATSAEIQAQIDAIMKQIELLQVQLSLLQARQGGTAWCHTFTTNLKIGNGGSEVQALINALSKDGSLEGTVSGTGEFDETIASAVTGFQEKYKDDILTPVGLKYGTGYVGPSTRAKLNKLYGCGNTSSSNYISFRFDPAVPDGASILNSTLYVDVASSKNPVKVELYAGATGTGMGMGNLIGTNTDVTYRTGESGIRTFKFSINSCPANPVLLTAKAYFSDGTFDTELSQLLFCGAQPSISSIAPSSGPIGTEIIINGSDFTPMDNIVYMGTHAMASRISDNNGTRLELTVPSAWGDGTAVVPGYYSISVSNNNGKGNTNYGFTVTAATSPSISTIYENKSDLSIVVSGSNLSGVVKLQYVDTLNNNKSGELSGAKLKSVSSNQAIFYEDLYIANSRSLFQITVVDSQGNVSNAVSVDNRQAVTPTIKVLSPNGGETWTFGVPQTVRWTETGISSGKTFGLYLTNPSGYACSLGGINALDGAKTVTLQENQVCPNNPNLRITAGQYKILIDAAPATGIENSGDSSDAPFTIAAQSVGSLTSSVNTSVSPTFYRGSINADISSYKITASPAESVNLKSLTLYFYPINTGDLQNVRVFVGGSQFGSAKSSVAGTYDVGSFAGNVTIPAGGTTQVDVWVDIGSSATYGTVNAITKLSTCLGSGISSGANILCSPMDVSGWGFTVKASTAVTISSVSSATSGSAVTVSWNNTAATYAKDWIGIAPHGGQWSSSYNWFYTDGLASGSKTITMPTTAGSYDLVYYQNNGYTEVGRTGPITVVNVSGMGVAPSSQYSASILENMKTNLDQIQKEINDLKR